MSSYYLFAIVCPHEESLHIAHPRPTDFYLCRDLSVRSGRLYDNPLILLKHCYHFNVRDGWDYYSEHGLIDSLSIVDCNLLECLRRLGIHYETSMIDYMGRLILGRCTEVEFSDEHRMMIRLTNGCEYPVVEL